MYKQNAPLILAILGDGRLEDFVFGVLCQRLLVGMTCRTGNDMNLPNTWLKSKNG